MLRERFSKLLVLLLWAHVPVLGLAAAWNGRMQPAAAMLIGAIIAATYQGIRQKYRIAAVARYASAVLLLAEPALLLLLFSGHPWQMDMHMYFFAILALNIAWFDRGTILVSSLLIAIHHLVLLYLLPTAVFPGQGDVNRVGLHAMIVLFQAGVLVWVSDMVKRRFEHIQIMDAELAVQRRALEERTREAEEASRAKSMFLANMSHEIRTPINAILGFSNLVQRTPLDPKQRDYVSKINTAGSALLRLINDILDFSKIEENKMEFESNPFDPRAAITSQVQLVSEGIRSKNLQIEVHIDDRVPAQVIGDEMRLNQVLLNLLSNAIKFSARGVIVVRLTLIDESEDIARIQCSVSDNGIGMTAEQIGRLFTAFTQADSTTTRRFGGTGLGLAISRQIVEQMGGWIKAESLIDIGSQFTFQVPLGIDRTVPTAVFEPSEKIRRQRILIADDNPAALHIISEIFRHWGMAVDTAGSGLEARDMAEREARAGRTYDLLLIDWKMPEIDGLQTVRDIRACPAIAVPPQVVMMTAYDTSDLIQAAALDNIRGFLCKPITPESLLHVLESLPGHATGGPQGPAPDPVAPAPDPVSGATILLVDDSAINREIATAFLKAAGFRVDHAENGLVACAKVAKNRAHYAAVLMDVQMPEMDGITATREIRRHHPATDLPIIAMTAHAYPEERQNCLDAGMNEHLTKPIDSKLLIRTLQSWIARLQPDAPKADLPAVLPPFDIKAALARLDGKADLLRRLIIEFGTQHADSCNELRSLVMEGRIEQARRLAHDLKAIAATLEIADLGPISAAIEDSLAKPDAAERGIAGIEQMLEDLYLALRPAVHAAAGLSDANTDAAAPDAAALDATPPDAAATGGGPADPAATLAACAALRPLIQRHSLSALAGFAALADALGLDHCARTAHPLARALQCYDYATAGEQLDTIELHARMDAAA